RQWHRCRWIRLAVRVSSPRLPPAVVLRLERTDQSRLGHQRLELGPARLAVDLRARREQVLDLLPLVAVEVGLDPGTEVLRLADVEDPAVAAAEQIDAG